MPDMLNLADWKNQATYPDPKTTSLHRWAYEFLLRNHKFCPQILNAVQEEEELLKSGGRLPLAWNERPTGRVLLEWGVDSRMLPEWIKKGLTDTPVRFGTFPKSLGNFTLEGKDVRISFALPDRVALEFDLTAPLRPQIARAERKLKASQAMFKDQKRTQGKNNVNKFPIYLRVLDMRDANLSRARMLEILSADDADGIGEDDVRNWINAAELLRDGGYRHIPQNGID